MSALPEFNPTHAVVENEGCPIHYWYQGTGPLLILIPGGNGHGRQYNPIIPYLSQHYTTATYDRRQMSSSLLPPGSPNKPLNPPQQARDALSIMRALSFTTTTIFGNSLGGIITLEAALSYASSLTAVVVHEAPTFTILPNSATHLDWIFGLLDIYRLHGAEAAEKAFAPVLVGYKDGETQRQELANVENQFANEILTASLYCPDLLRIKDVPIAVGYGVDSLDALYVQTTVVQAERLKCPRVKFPGYHQGFETEPEEFAKVLLKTYEELGSKK